MNFKAILKSILIVGALAALSGAAKAVKDTVSHHYATSVFAKLGNEQYWNADVSWKNKYKDYNNANIKPRFVMATTWLVSLTDAWHLFDMLHRVFLIAAGVMGGIYASRSVGLGWRYWQYAFYHYVYILVAGAVSFHVCYTYLFIVKSTV